MRFWKAKKINGSPVVGVGVAVFLSDQRQAAALECLVQSFRAQTWPQWQLLLCHDGPLPGGYDGLVERLTIDRRVSWHATLKREQQFGHPHRQWQLDTLGKTCQWLGLTNGDNYYAPVYLEWLLSVGTTAKGCNFVYCDLVHSHKMWKAMTTEPKRGKLDLGGWLAAATLCRQIRFDKFTFAGDGDYINRLRSSAKVVQKVNANLFVHN